MSIRRRLTLWNTLGFAAVLAGFGVMIYLLVGRALRQQADRAADNGFRLMESDPRLAANPEARARYWVREFDEHMGVLAGVYRADGSPIDVRPGLARHFPAPPPAPPARFLHVDADGERWLATCKVDEFFGDEVHVLEASGPTGPWRVISRLPMPTVTGDERTCTYDAQARADPTGAVRLWWSNNAFTEADVRADPSRYRPRTMLLEV